MAKKVRKTRKTKKRTAKKKTARKKPAARKRAVRPKKKRVAKKKPKAPAKGPKLPAEPIGRVTHYFRKAKATAIVIERDTVRVGDLLYFKGHTTRFKQAVQSLQIDRQPVPEASSGQEVGIQTKSRTREGDLVFKL